MGTLRLMLAYVLVKMPHSAMKVILLLSHPGIPLVTLTILFNWINLFRQPRALGFWI